MAQGMGNKLRKKAPPSVAKMKKQNQTLKKGRRVYQTKKKHKMTIQKEVEGKTTKAINKKNESMIACKAVSAGAKFFLSDISEKGQNELQQQLKERNKKEIASKKLTNRLQEQLRKIRE